LALAKNVYEKRACKIVMKSMAGVNFTNILRKAFTLVDPESVKNTVKSSVSFYAFGICNCGRCTYNVAEIEPR